MRTVRKKDSIFWSRNEKRENWREGVETYGRSGHICLDDAIRLESVRY